MTQIPRRFQHVDFEKDIPKSIKDKFNDIRDTKKGLYLYGNVGVGKTHILYALVKKWDELRTEEQEDKRDWEEKRTEARLENREFNEKLTSKTRPNSHFWNMTQLLYEIRSAYGKKNDDYVGWSDNINSFSDYIIKGGGLYFIDDIGSEKVTEWVEEIVYLLINVRYEQTAPMIFSSNLSLSELAEKIGDRSASRIKEMCHIIKLDGEDRRLNI